MTRHRRSDAGVTLVEMLVVLALFGVVAGTVLIAFPGDRRGTSTETAARLLGAHIDRAVDLALTTGQGFGVAQNGRTLSFVQRGPDMRWTPHSDKQLATVKLSTGTTRISFDTNEVYAVSADLIPEKSLPLVVQYGTRTVVFDGARVHLENTP
ncbi:prepilin-type N-terminal cleavage/methylation domain-containing protein [uncultured Tateyamaria sp.]|uniref:pilus assembly FimT family protein n=1 Tax=Tateyamaria sp. 1078 TaxID=3417464 RepID=UPI00262EB6A9|nr:prepilin-type N-terminal cleavage/methylation domain-containing protein [uncultured Tateyamaria sp.]